MAESSASSRSCTPAEPLAHCRPYTRKDWERQRQRIEYLYCKEDRPLKCVIDEMKSRHGFSATERQYKRKITEWHLDKNVKDDEMRAILTMQETRRKEGKGSMFYVRGRLVSSKKIERFRQRKGVGRGLDVISQVGEAPADFKEDISCRSPPPEPCLTGNIEGSPRALGNGPSSDKLSTQPAGPEAIRWKPRSKVFTLLEPNLQSYNDPSIVEWYKSREASPESDRAPTTGRTSEDYPGFGKTQTLPAPDQYPIQLTDGSLKGPPFGLPEGSTAGASQNDSHGIEVETPRRLPVQSLLNSTQTDERPSKDFGTARLGDRNIEDLVLDGLRWLSSYAP